MIYTRLSQDRTGDAEAPERQLNACKEYAEQNGWIVVDDLEDRDTSAFSGKATRSGYDAAIEMVTRGEADLMLAWKLDRVHRSLGQFARLHELLAEHGARFETVVERYNSADPAQIITGQVLAMVAEQESRNTSVRQKAAVRSKAEKGEPSGGGARPYGYEYDKEAKTYRIVEHEADVIRRVAAELIAGESLNGVCRKLNTEGVPTAKGARWYPITLSNLFRSDVQEGVRRFEGKVVADGNWDTILDAATLARVRARFARNASGKEAKASSLLAGIASCGKCGGKLRTSRSRRRGELFERYACGKTASNDQCGGLGITREPTDELFTELLFRRVESIRNETATPDRDVEIARLRRECDEAKENLADMLRARLKASSHAHDVYDRVITEQSDTLADLTDRIEALRSEVPRLEVEDVRTWWETATLTQRRDMVRQHVEALAIAPVDRATNRFEPKRVTSGLVWRS